MKRVVLTSMAVAMTSMSGLAQHDMSASWVNHASGSTVSGNSFNGTFDVVNEGANSASTGDTLWVAYTIDGGFYSLDLTPGSASYIVLSSDFQPGDTITTGAQGTPTLGGLSSPVDVCTVVFGIGMSSVSPSFPMDTNPNDNVDCFILDPTATSGLEEGPELALQVEQTPSSLEFEFQGEATELRVFNSKGSSIRVIQLNSGQTTGSVDLSDWTPGIYTVHLVGDSSQCVRRIAIQ